MNPGNFFNQGCIFPIFARVFTSIALMAVIYTASGAVIAEQSPKIESHESQTNTLLGSNIGSLSLEAVSAFLSDVQKTRKKLETREEKLNVLEEQLQRRSLELDAREVETRILEQMARKRYRFHSETAQASQRRVTEYYELAEPETVGELLRGMPPKFSAGILSSLSAKKIAKIIEQLEPEYARSVGAELASSSLIWSPNLEGN